MRRTVSAAVDQEERLLRVRQRDDQRVVTEGGIGAMLSLARRVGLIVAIDARLHLLEATLPEIP